MTRDHSVMKSAIDRIADERARQIKREGYAHEHDDLHYRGQLAMAAATYAMPADERIMVGRLGAPVTWPSSWEFKPDTDRIRELVKAGALIVAEIERLQRDGV